MARLTLALLKGPTRVGMERLEHLGRLLAIESRAIASLPALEFSLLRSTTAARHSGFTLRGPDTVLAEQYLFTRRDGIATRLQILANDTHAQAHMLDAVRDQLDDLLRAVDLIDTTLYPRLADPAITVASAFERAAASRNQTVEMDGASDVQVAQVRGLLRLIAEAIAVVGGHAHVRVERNGTWAEVQISPDATESSAVAPPTQHLELVRLAGYLLRIPVEPHEGGLKLSIVACDT